MSRTLLLIAAALALASPARATEAQFRDWWAACDEQRTCWAFGFAPEDRPGEAFVRIERSYGRFQRSFTLGVPVQHDAVRATYRDGVLEIHLPKSEETKPRKVQVTNGQ